MCASVQSVEADQKDNWRFGTEDQIGERRQPIESSHMIVSLTIFNQTTGAGTDCFHPRAWRHRIYRNKDRLAGWSHFVLLDRKKRREIGRERGGKGRKDGGRHGEKG